MYHLHFTLPIQNLLQHALPTTTKTATIYLVLTVWDSRPNKHSFLSTPGFWLKEYTHQHFQPNGKQAMIFKNCKQLKMPNVRLSFTCCSEEQGKGLHKGLKRHLLNHKPTFTSESSLLRCASGELGLKRPR